MINQTRTKKILKHERRHVEMKNEKLVYSAPSIKVELVEEDILTWSVEDEEVTFDEVTFQE
ncbi:MAG: hypothetical protein IKJ07_07085 [Clostridia bacterium]|nr:hypothetical protein [Clostridia bacterium]